MCPTTDASLLFYAVQRNNDDEATALCKLLCEELLTCDPKQVDRNQQTALFFAARDGNAQCVRYLTSRGCHPDHRDSALQTALFYAARDGRVKAVEALLDSGANVNNADHLGQTALFYGARDGRTATVALMLERGANMNLRDRHRRTALYYAIRNNHRDMVALLKATVGSSDLVSQSKPDSQGTPLLECSSPSLAARPDASPLPSGASSVSPGPSAHKGSGVGATKRARTTGSAVSWSGADSHVNGQAVPAELQPIRRRCYRLSIRAPESLGEDLHWLSAPLHQVKLFESLVPSVAVWPRDAACPVPDILADLRTHWQPLALGILDELSQSEGGWVFLKPVDCKAWRCPDYYDVIKCPMDFMTMRKRFKAQGYTRCSEFVADMELIFSNCFRYNRPESHVAALGRSIQTQYKTLAEVKGLDRWIEKEAVIEQWYNGQLCSETASGGVVDAEGSSRPPDQQQDLTVN